MGDGQRVRSSVRGPAILESMRDAPRPYPRKPEAKEGTESAELFSATLGFDFIFSTGTDGRKHCYCIEINGDNSGISGIQDIPKGGIDDAKRVVAKVRGAFNPQFMRMRAIIGDFLDGEFSATPEGHKQIEKFLIQQQEKTPMFEHAFRNAPYITAIARNKLTQYQFIPRENRPRIYHGGESKESSTGYWVCKPKNGTQGRDILIMNNKEFEQLFRGGMEQHNIAQEFIHSSGAERAPKGMRKNPASMRFLMDFRYLQNGDIVPVFEAAYQRISPFAGNSTEISKRMGDGARESLLVQSKARGALSVPASEEEIRLAREVAGKIIRNIARGYEKFAPSAS